MARIIYSIQRPLAMKFSFILILGIMIGVVPSVAQTEASSLAPWDGRKVFEDKGCNKCHSVRGKGANRGPDLGESRYYGTYLEFAAIMWNHFPKMSSTMSEMGMRYPEFTPEEIRQLIVYILYQRYTAEKGSEFQGRKLLREKKCFSCHRFGGEGGEIGPDVSKIDEYLSPLRLVEAMWNHGPEMMKLFERYDIRRPEFREHDIVDMAVAIRAYLPGTNKVSIYAYDMGNPDVGKNIVAEKGCLNCHSMLGGKTEKRAPAFNNIKFDCSVTQMAGRMWNHGNVMWPAMKKRGLAVPKFEPGEMAHVISYLFSLSLEDSPGSTANGRMILNEKRCLFCHSLQNQGGRIAGDLAKVDGMDTPMAMIATMWNHAPAMRKKQIKHKFSWTELSVREMADLYALFQKTAGEKNVKSIDR